MQTHVSFLVKNIHENLFPDCVQLVTIAGAVFVELKPPILHIYSIPEACMEAIKPRFEKLATVENIRALQHDFSTDHNEAFNSTIWAVDSKSTSSSMPAVQSAADLATLRHNLGWELTTKRIYSGMEIKLPEERVL